jgi:hypothetical protein
VVDEDVAALVSGSFDVSRVVVAAKEEEEEEAEGGSWDCARASASSASIWAISAARSGM